MYFSTQEYFDKMIKMGSIPSLQIQDNAEAFLKKINVFLEYLFQEKLLPEDYKIILNSGWRTSAYNEEIHGAPGSNHCIGRAIDIHGCEIINICTKDPSVLEKFELYAESNFDTCRDGEGWTHLQDVSPRSDNRIFRA